MTRRSPIAVALACAGASAGLLWSAGALRAAPAAVVADPLRGRAVYARCAACHTVGRTGGTRMGPSLNGVVGRKAGSVPGYIYSAPMLRSGLIWEEATLARFLRNPQKVVPGTKMAFAGLGNVRDQADVVAYVKEFQADGSRN